MTLAATLAVQSAALPFVQVWKGLDPALEVVSLETPQNGWKQLLAGQGIGLREGADQIPQATAVATGFDRLDTHTAETLESWAVEARRTLRPGGLLVLGGANPEHPQSGHQGLFPAAAVRALSQAGFARVCLIRPVLTPGDTSLSSALYGGCEAYAAVAQTQAFGKAFDVFSPVFLETSTASPTDSLRRAEEAFLGRIGHVEAILNVRITDTENAALERLRHTETTLQNQHEEIARLHETIGALTHLTRRRGLRKLVHRIKQKWRTPSVPPPDAPQIVTAPSPAPAAATPEPVPAPIFWKPAPPADPVPLSPREADLRARLFGTKAQ